jgi:hypothetical protein
VSCVLDETPDLRLRHYHQKHRRTLSKVFETIRVGNAAQKSVLFSLINRKASEEEIEDYIDQLALGLGASADSRDESPREEDLDQDESFTGYLQQFAASPVEADSGRSIWQNGAVPNLSRDTSGSVATGRPSISSAPSDTRTRHGSHSDIQAQGVHADAMDVTEDVVRALPNFGNLSMSRSLLTNNYPENIQRRQLHVLGGRLEECVPLNLDTESRADRLSSAMLAFRDAARQMIALGQPVDQVLSMQGLDLELLFRDRTPADPHTVSTWACEYTKTWTFLPLHVRLSSVHYAGSLMRWLIMPCKETYRLVSKLMRPLDSQLFIPHTGDVDMCHLPCVRATQLEHGGKWVNHVTADSQRCQWIEGKVQAIEERTVETAKGPVQMKMLSAAFIDFVDDVRNWSLSSTVLQDFPELGGKISFHDDGPELNP